MPVLFEAVVKNTKGLTFELKRQLDSTFGENFSSEKSECSSHQNWKSRGYDIDLTRDAAVMTNRKDWWSFCAEREDRAKCFVDSHKLALLLGSDEVLCVPESANIALSAMDGATWKAILEEVEQNLKGPLTDFSLFEIEEAFEGETNDAFIDDYYFRFKTRDIAKQMRTDGPD